MLAAWPLLGWPAPPLATDAAPELSAEAVFRFKPAFGRALQGRIPADQVDLHRLADGRWQAVATFASQRAEVAGHPAYTRLLRGQAFLDAARHPTLRYVTEPFLPGSLRPADALDGSLEMRGRRRAQALRLDRPGCDRPLQACPLRARAELRRSDFGMDAWRHLVADRIELELHVEPLP